MTSSEIARVMGEYIREHGFSPEWSVFDGCGCYAHAWANADPEMAIVAGIASNWSREPMRTLRKIVGSNFGELSLRAAGWTEGCTDDAAAACDIAADLLAP